jgi:hypothetical protein
MTNFLEGCSQTIVKDRIQTLVEPCLILIKNGISFIKENALAMVAAIAEAANRLFIPYWKEPAELVFNILSSYTKPEYKQLRGQAIETLSLIGVAVGRDHFKLVADRIIDAMLEI